MSGDPALIGVLSGLTGATLGTTLTFLYARRGEQEKQYWTTRTQAYVDYVTAVAERARASPTHTQRYQELSAKVDDASYRICIYGSRTVVEALAEFEGLWQAPDPGGGQVKFLNLCAQMRRDSAAKGGPVAIETLQRAFFVPEDITAPSQS